MPPTDWLAARVTASPYALALCVGANRWSYAELDELVNHACGWLVAHGYQPNSGQRVALLLDNSAEYVALIYAVARLGGELLLLNTRLTAVELQSQLRQLPASHYLTSAEHAAKLPHPLLIIPNDNFRQATPWHAPSHWPTDPHATQAIFFTSGTTGQPKAVQLSFANHFYSALGSAYKLGVLPHDLWLSCLPLYHVGGLAVLFRSCLYGTAVDLHPRWELSAINHALDHQPITLLSLVPTMLHRLLESRTSWPPSLRLLLLGGAAASPELVAEANARSQTGPIVATTYGMTEAASQIVTQLPQETARKPHSVGRPLLFTQLEVRSANGNQTKPNEIGEIWVQGPTVTRGYLDNATANAERFVAGWFRTGDMGYVDEAGDLCVVQRRADLLVSGGENVYPAEVEAVLRQHPAVADVCVVGLPSAEWGQMVAALVQPVPDVPITAEGLLAYARTQLAGYKQPRYLQFTPQLPLTASGKVSRTAVLSLLQTADT
jgi:o-succinylbenzoate---CoA ligase